MDSSTTCGSTTACSRPTRVEDLALNYRARAILSGINGKRTKEQAEYLTRVLPRRTRRPMRCADCSPSSKPSRSSSDDLKKPIPTAMVMAEMKKPRETFVLARGDYRNQTDKVQPGVPAMLPPLPKDAPLNRLTLAKWLVQPDIRSPRASP